MKNIVSNISICLTFTLNTIGFLPKANAQPMCQVSLSDGSGSYLNVRGTGPTGEVIDQLSHGNPVSIISIFDDWNGMLRNSWYKVRATNGYQNTVGWVDSNYINCYNPVATTQEFQTTKPCRRYAETTLYNQPNGQRVSRLKSQTLIYPINSSQGWVKLGGFTRDGVYQEFGWADGNELGDCKF